MYSPRRKFPEGGEQPMPVLCSTAGTGRVALSTHGNQSLIFIKTKYSQLLEGAGTLQAFLVGELRSVPGDPAHDSADCV